MDACRVHHRPSAAHGRGRGAAGHTGAVSLIQRLGSALNLNIHFHMLFLDGMCLIDEAGLALFRYVPEPGEHRAAPSASEGRAAQPRAIPPDAPIA